MTNWTHYFLSIWTVMMLHQSMICSQIFWSVVVHHLLFLYRNEQLWHSNISFEMSWNYLTMFNFECTVPLNLICWQKRKHATISSHYISLYFLTQSVQNVIKHLVCPWNTFPFDWNVFGWMYCIFLYKDSPFFNHSVGVS